MSTIAQRLEAATAKAEAASNIAQQWANGPAGSTVTTTSGELPTLAEFLDRAQDKISDIEISASITVKSIKDLQYVERTENRLYIVAGFRSGQVTNGGIYIWRPTVNKTSHNGTMFIAPEAIEEWDGSADFQVAFYNWTGTGSGCWYCLSNFMCGDVNPMEGNNDLNKLPDTDLWITESSGVANLPPGWPQGRYYVFQYGRNGSAYQYQRIVDFVASGSSGGNVCRTAERRLRGGGLWSDWFEQLNTNSARFRELTPNLATIAALRARAGLFNEQRVFVSEYNLNTDQGGGTFRWSSTSTQADNGVTVFAVSGVATGRWLRDFDVLIPEMAGCIGDNTTNNDAAIARLIAFAKIDRTEIHWRGKYLASSANIADFHLCSHHGSGQISKNGQIWFITPTEEQENVIYTGPSGTAANDGLSSATPTTIANALAILKRNGNKAGDGAWRVQMLPGTNAENGIRVGRFPQFRNPVRVWGAEVAANAVPTSIWDGTNATNAFAFRQDGGQAAVANWEFKNIFLRNWTTGSGNTGGILVWAQGSTICENIHCDNMGIGLWGRHGYFRFIGGNITNVDTWGIGVQYGASANVGDLSGNGVRIRGRVAGSAVGVAVGRNTTAYVQGCDIDNTNTHINITRLSRARTQGNTFGANYNVACVWVDNGGDWTPDNNSGYPDIYPALSESKPAYRAESGAIHQMIDRGSQRSLNQCSDGQIITFTDTTRALLSSLNSTFTPFRLPAWFLFSPTFRLDVEIGIALNTGAGGVLSLHGQGDAASNQLATITIPNVAAFTRGIVRFSVVQSAGVSTARYSAEFRAAGILNEMITTPSLSTTALRDNSELDLIFRLYWQSNNTNQVQIFCMRTYVEA